ncbi:iron chelate uptake ABC transporter family permease subunit [Deinococcus radiophilus]|uniref:iron chelate uptake ABC transporter family permease subunit n=1 Tax=Deinococcus radiophilus TaxID=32062 RepID=UPI00361D3D2A
MQEGDVIIWDIRLPRVLMAVLVGACLSICGAAFQGVFRNPLADPYLLGVASGAAVGATAGLVLDLPRAILPLTAMLTALATVAITLMLGRSGRRFPPTRLILAGVVMGSFLGAVTTFLIMQGEDRAREVLAYTLGDLGFSSWGDIGRVLPYALLGCGTLIGLGRALDLLQLGDLTASSLGLPVEKLRLLVIVAGSLATAAAVAYTGVIGFVGLIVPHTVRLIWGPSHRVLLPVSALAGASCWCWPTCWPAPPHFHRWASSPRCWVGLFPVPAAASKGLVMTETETFSAHGLQVRAGDFPAVRGVSVSFPAGRLSAVIGPNGAGKSTLLRGMLGLTPVQSGRVELLGRPLAEWSRAERARQLAYLAQTEACPSTPACATWWRWGAAQASGAGPDSPHRLDARGRGCRDRSVDPHRYPGLC